MSDHLTVPVQLLKTAASDPSGRVRLEAIVAASWVSPEEGLAVLEVAGAQPLDDWMLPSYDAALASLGVEQPSLKEEVQESEASPVLALGKEIYEREGFCSTCHQSEGEGLPASGFPPLAGTKWVQGSEELIIKIVLKGLMGPIEVNGQDYPGQVPMTAYENMLNDEEIAAVVSYVRSSFGNSAGMVDAATVSRVRKETADKKGFYSPDELKKQFPAF